MKRDLPSERIRWGFLAAVFALASTWLAMLLGGTGTLDASIYEAVYAEGHPFELGLARLFTALGEPTVLIGACILCALWLWYAGRGRLGLSLLIVAFLGRGLSELQKFVIDRPRPELRHHLVVVKTQSFPSGHATSSMIFYLALALALTTHNRWRVPLIISAVVLSLLIGTSRVMLGVHWPSDVVAGWSFGMLWVLLALGPVERALRAS